MTRRERKHVAKPKAASARPPVAALSSARPPIAALCTQSASLRAWLLGGMTALWVARPLFPSEAAATGDGLTVVMLWIALAVFWMLGAIGRPSDKGDSAHLPERSKGCFAQMGSFPFFRFGATDAAVLALMLCFTAATLWAVAHGSPRPAINVLWEWLGMGLSFFLARQLISTPREARAVVAVMVALAVGISAYAIYKWAYVMPQDLATYDANPDKALREAGLSLAPGSPERKLFRDRLASNLPDGTFALSNSLAAFVATWLVIAAGIAWSSLKTGPRLAVGRLRELFTVGWHALKGRERDASHDSAGSTPFQGVPPWARSSRTFLHDSFTAAICLVPLGICLAITKSRSGCIAAAVGLVGVWMLSGRRRFHWGWRASALAGLLLATVVALAAVFPQPLALASKSLGYRVQYWQSSLKMIADHPWLGCGPGNFQNAYTQYKLPEASEEVADPHNFLLEIWSTAGTLAALAFLAVLICFAWRRGERGEGRAEREDARGLSTSVPSSTGAKSEARNPKSEIPNPSCDAWPFVLAGGGVGFLLSWPLGAISAAPPGITPIAIGLPLAAATVVLLSGWIRDGEMPGWLPALGVTVMLVDLLTTGGIGFSGVAGTLWLLLCLGLQGRGRRTFRGWTAWAGLGAAVALAWACYLTAYNPVLTCQAHLRKADRKAAAGLNADRLSELKAAVTADPLSAEPWQQLTSVWFSVWWLEPSPEALKLLQRADENALRLLPNSAAVWLASGDWQFQAAGRKDDDGKAAWPEAIRGAVAAYRQAVALYPNSAIHHAKLAEAYRAAGDRSAFRREAEAALRLDRLTPHADKKLPADLRSRLREP
ncbi:MAG: O-antigen ligase family protein [Thermoguttaceae bacterium]